LSVAKFRADIATVHRMVPRFPAVDFFRVGVAASIVPKLATAKQSTADRFCDLCDQSFGCCRSVCDWKHGSASQGRSLKLQLLVDQTIDRNA